MGQGSPSKLGQSMQSGAPQQGAPQQGAPQQGMPAGKGGQVFQPQQGPGQGRIQVDNSQRPPGSEMDYGFRPQTGNVGQGVFDAKSQPTNNQTDMQNVFAQYMKMQQPGQQQAQQAPMVPPVASPMQGNLPPALMQQYMQMRPPAPNAQQVMPEDPRMQAMRNLQRTGGTSIFQRSANVKNY